MHLTALCSYVIMFRSRVSSSTPNKREYCDFINSNSHLDFIINLLNIYNGGGDDIRGDWGVSRASAIYTLHV